MTDAFERACYTNEHAVDPPEQEQPRHRGASYCEQCRSARGPFYHYPASPTERVWLCCSCCGIDHPEDE